MFKIKHYKKIITNLQQYCKINLKLKKITSLSQTNKQNDFWYINNNFYSQYEKRLIPYNYIQSLNDDINVDTI